MDLLKKTFTGSKTSSCVLGISFISDTVEITIISCRTSFSFQRFPNCSFTSNGVSNPYSQIPGLTSRSSQYASEQLCQRHHRYSVQFSLLLNITFLEDCPSTHLIPVVFIISTNQVLTLLVRRRKGALGALPDPGLINSLLSIKGNTKGDDIDVK